MKLFYAFILAALLVSCDTSPEYKRQVREENERYFSKPDTVGTLSDGRVIQRVVLGFENGNHSHTVYFVGSTITVNQTVPVGKTTYNDVSVMIDGVKFVPAAKDQ